jgi:hypothetical protein
MDLQAQVRMALKEKRMLQKTLSKEIGFSEAMLSLWLNKKIKSENVEKAVRLSSHRMYGAALLRYR